MTATCTDDSAAAAAVALQGAIMGVLLYGTVDLTNCALVSSWSWLISLVDMAWGTTACAVTALVQVSLYSWLSRSAAVAERGS
jgi:uncharacterized membrane protein